MGLSNAAKRARFYSQTINQNQGGGPKKAGFPHLIARDSWTSIYLGDGPNNCAGLRCFQTNFRLGMVRQSRPIGTPVNISYFGPH